MSDDEWSCPNCGSGDPHDALILNEGPDGEGLEIDVTCDSVYVTPTDSNDGFAFDHDQFAEVVEHFQNSEYADV